MKFTPELYIPQGHESAIHKNIVSQLKEIECLGIKNLTCPIQVRQKNEFRNS